MEYLEDMKVITTTNDAIAFMSENHDDDNKSLVLEIKSQYYTSNDINVLNTFLMSDFMEALYDGAYFGNKSFFKLYALLNLKGFGKELNVETGIRMMKMLAYSGDIFALKLLEKYDKTFNYTKVIEVLDQLKESFSVIVTEDIRKKYPEDVVLFVEKVMCYKDTVTRNKIKVLAVNILQYILVTKDEHKVIMNNICNMDAGSYKLLLNTEYFKNRRYGF